MEVWNKVDLIEKGKDRLIGEEKGDESIKISATLGTGIKNLMSKIE